MSGYAFSSLRLGNTDSRFPANKKNGESKFSFLITVESPSNRGLSVVLFFNIMKK